MKKLKKNIQQKKINDIFTSFSNAVEDPTYCLSIWKDKSFAYGSLISIIFLFYFLL
jgi:hypothetical protein